MRKPIDASQKSRPLSASLKPALAAKANKRANAIGGFSRYVQLLVRYDLEKDTLSKALALEARGHLTEGIAR